jgi:hypothetical protein
MTDTSSNTQNELQYYKDYTNPRLNGPGCWFTIHTLAFYAKTKEEKHSFVNTMTTIANYFPCLKCRKHALEYIEKHPIQQAIDKKDGLFIWTWKFHNSVNYKLGKHIMSYELAYKIYSELTENDEEEKVCSEECSGEKSEDKEEKVKKEEIKKDVKKEVNKKVNTKEGAKKKHKPYYLEAK